MSHGTDADPQGFLVNIKGGRMDRGGDPKVRVAGAQPVEAGRNFL